MKLEIESIKNRIKSYMCEVIKRIEITHRLDYEKYPIYLHDNVRLASCKKEPDTIKWIETFNKGDIVFDIGANVGAYSLVMSKYARKIYAFEPSIFTYNTLLKNIYTNKSFNITPVNIALAATKKIEAFVYSSLDRGGSGHGLGACIGKEAYKQEVIAYSIDEFIEDFKIELPQHIKLDIDGGELGVLRGANKTIKDENFKTLLVEIDEQNMQLFKYLESLGLHNIAKYYIGDGKAYNYLYAK